MLTPALSRYPRGMLSGGSATLLPIQLPPVLSGRSAVVIHPFPFEQGCNDALLASSGVAKFFLMPFSKVFIFYGGQWTFAPHVCVDSLGAVSRLGSPQRIAAVDGGIRWSQFLFLGETPGNCFSTCLL